MELQLNNSELVVTEEGESWVCDHCVPSERFLDLALFRRHLELHHLGYSVQEVESEEDQHFQDESMTGIKAHGERLRLHVLHNKVQIAADAAKACQDKARQVEILKF